MRLQRFSNEMDITRVCSIEMNPGERIEVVVFGLFTTMFIFYFLVYLKNCHDRRRAAFH